MVKGRHVHLDCMALADALIATGVRVSAPLGWNRRHEPGIVGALARWHGARRVRRTHAALEYLHTPTRRPLPATPQRARSGTTSA